MLEIVDVACTVCEPFNLELIKIFEITVLNFYEFNNNFYYFEKNY
jgi:hypothetical protein